MTAEEKTRLFTFLSTAQDSLSGYRTDTEIPEFTDDSVSFDIASPGVPSTLEEIAAAVARCTACSLCRTRKNAVPGEGPGEIQGVQVLVVGEAPGADEDSSGRPFVGRSGELLDKMLASINLSRKINCYIANIVKCRPPLNRDPSPEESAACIGFLESQITQIQPRFILALGRIASQTLLHTTEGIHSLRGRFHDYQGIPLLPTYHPSALLRDETLKRPAWEDLKMLRSALDKQMV